MNFVDIEKINTNYIIPRNEIVEYDSSSRSGTKSKKNKASAVPSKKTEEEVPLGKGECKKLIRCQKCSTPTANKDNKGEYFRRGEKRYRVATNCDVCGKYKTSFIAESDVPDDIKKKSSPK
jgi:hypothetical protein